MSPVVTVTTCAPPPVDRGEVFRYAACRRPGAEEERLLDSCLEELGDRLRAAEAGRARRGEEERS